MPVFSYLVFLSSALEKQMAPHSSTLAWKIPWTEEPDIIETHIRDCQILSQTLFTECSRVPASSHSGSVRRYSINPRMPKDPRCSGGTCISQGHAAGKQCSGLSGAKVCTLTMTPQKVPRHAGFPRGEHRGSRHRLGSSLRSPAEGEGNEGFPPPPDKAAA